MKKYKPHISSLGYASANTIAIAAYLCLMLFWSFGIVFIAIIFLQEKKSGLVRFHAVQAGLLWLVRLFLGGGIAFEGLAAVSTGDTSYLNQPGGWNSDLTIIIIRIAIDLIIIACAMVAISYAYRWRTWRVPVVGLLAQMFAALAQKPAYNGEGDVPAGCRVGTDPDAERPEWQPSWEEMEAARLERLRVPPDDALLMRAQAIAEEEKPTSAYYTGREDEEEEAEAAENSANALSFLARIKRSLGMGETGMYDGEESHLDPAPEDAMAAWQARYLRPQEKRFKVPESPSAGVENEAYVEALAPHEEESERRPVRGMDIYYSEAEYIDHDREIDELMERSGGASLLDRLFGGFSRRVSDGIRDAGHPGDDLDSQLPEGMRDPPPPTDM